MPPSRGSRPRPLGPIAARAPPLTGGPGSRPSLGVSWPQSLVWPAGSQSPVPSRRCQGPHVAQPQGHPGFGGFASVPLLPPGAEGAPGGWTALTPPQLDQSATGAPPPGLARWPPGPHPARRCPRSHPRLSQAAGGALPPIGVVGIGVPALAGAGVGCLFSARKGQILSPRWSGCRAFPCCRRGRSPGHRGSGYGPLLPSAAGIPVPTGALAVSPPFARRARGLGTCWSKCGVSSLCQRAWGPILRSAGTGFVPCAY